MSSTLLADPPPSIETIDVLYIKNDK